MSSFPTHIQRLIDNGYRFKFGDYIGDAFDIVKQEIGPFAGFTVIFIIAQSIGSAIPVVGDLAISLFVTPCMMAGLYLYARRVDERRPREFGTFFDGFQYWKELIVIAAIEFALFFAFGLLMFLVLGLSTDFILSPENILLSDPSFSGTQTLLIFALLIPVIYLSVAWAFAPLLVLFEGMRGWEAMEASRQILTRSWFSMFGLMIVSGIIAALGVLGLVIALLFTIPVALVIVYTAYRDIVGVERSSQDKIIDHFVI